MHGRTALAALLVSAALSGCGQTSVAPARIEMTNAPPAPAARATPSVEAVSRPSRRRGGRIRTGTLKTEPTVPAPAGAPAATPVHAPRLRPGSVRRFRASQLRALHAYCASRPAADPRCVDGRVDERVAFAFEEAR